MYPAIRTNVFCVTLFGVCSISWWLSLDEFLPFFFIFIVFARSNSLAAFYIETNTDTSPHNMRDMTCFNDQSLFSVYAQFSQYQNQNANRLHASTVMFHCKHTCIQPMRAIQCQQFSFFKTQASLAYECNLWQRKNNMIDLELVSFLLGRLYLRKWNSRWLLIMNASLGCGLSGERGTFFSFSDLKSIRQECLMLREMWRNISKRRKKKSSKSFQFEYFSRVFHLCRNLLESTTI